MRECSKALSRRLTDSNFINKYFSGDGIDIGGRPDPLSLYSHVLPRVRSIRIWDKEDGDASFLDSVQDNSFDFVHSSHCLEHLEDPYIGLFNWFRVLKPLGYLIVTVPDEDLYEQSTFPSTFNCDHKNTFTISKAESWSPRSINLLSLIATLGDTATIKKLEVIDHFYNYTLPRYDQTLTPNCECSIEFIVQKLDTTGISLRQVVQPSSPSINILNQYTADQQSLRNSNSSTPPFNDSSPL